ncbi:hypothetical protein ACROYT_G022071 [Oculina patagonica]
MEMKILFIAILFVGACAGFYLPEEEEDALGEYEGQDLEEISNDEAETDLEDPSKKPKDPKCSKGKERKCFTIWYCYRKQRICGCFSKKKYGDETEFDNQVNDEMLATAEDQEEQLDENDQELEDPYYKKVDGKWGEWGPWSKCSKTCKKGKQSRTRKCNKPAPKYGGKKCKGPSKETRDCNEKVPCPVPRPRCKYGFFKRCFYVKDEKKSLSNDMTDPRTERQSDAINLNEF